MAEVGALEAVRVKVEGQEDGDLPALRPSDAIAGGECGLHGQTPFR